MKRRHLLIRIPWDGDGLFSKKHLIDIGFFTTRRKMVICLDEKESVI